MEDRLFEGEESVLHLMGEAVGRSGNASASPALGHLSRAGGRVGAVVQEPGHGV